MHGIKTNITKTKTTPSRLMGFPLVIKVEGVMVVILVLGEVASSMAWLNSLNSVLKTMMEAGEVVTLKAWMSSMTEDEVVGDLEALRGSLHSTVKMMEEEVVAM